MRLSEPVGSEGGRVLVEPLGARCSGEVSARWPQGTPSAAGLESRVEATWIPRAGPAGRADGTLVVHGADAPTGSPSPGARLRTVLGRASRELYGSRAPLVDALMLGRRGGIDPDLQDRFAQSGLVHLLSISGFHVGLIGGWVLPGGAVARARAEIRRSWSRQPSAPPTSASSGGPRRPPARRRWPSSWRDAGCGSATCAPTSCWRPRASSCSWSTRGPCSISEVGSRPRHCGAPRASAAGPTAPWARGSAGARLAPRSAPRWRRRRSRRGRSAPSLRSASSSTSRPSRSLPWRYRACW